MSNIRLSKSGIEYLDYSWGIFSGCHNIERGICPVKACWAKKITERFSSHYPNGFEPTFYPEALESPIHLRKPSRIGVGWVGDVIGYGHEYKELIYNIIEACPQHQFLFLTKNSQNLAKWFPDNCWVGVTATTTRMFVDALDNLNEVEAKTVYLSLEPLLEWSIASGILYRDLTAQQLDWLIIGAQTKPLVLPKREWVEEIVAAADKAGVKVFLKNNLKPLFPEGLRQELPQ